MTSDQMLAVLERLRGSGAEFGGFLANHGPMAADALIRLGGGDQADRWVEQYRLRLGPAAAPGNAVTAGNWQRDLGCIDRLGDWESYFRTAVAESGWEAVLAEWWPRLLPGAAASAAHGLIRTAHAVRNLVDGDDSERLLLGELAAGLAYWAARYQTLPGEPTLSGRLALTDAVARLPRLDPTTVAPDPGIGSRLELLWQVSDLPDALAAWGPDTAPLDALDDLVDQAAHVLLTRRREPIALCHAVTAPAAVRMIWTSIPTAQHNVTIASCWQLVGSIIAAFASTPDPGEPTPPTATPDDLARRAVEHGDEHVIKLTEACLRQFALTGSDTFLATAEAFRHRITPTW